VLDALEKLPSLNGLKYSDLPESQRRKFATKALRIVVLEDTTTFEIRQEIFRRINTSGEKARPSEVRRGAFRGLFMDFIDQCANDQQFCQLCPISDTMRLHREPQELLLRFFAYSERYKQFRHDVERFLDKFVEDNRDRFDHERFLAEFHRTMSFVSRYLPHGFAKSRSASSLRIIHPLCSI